MSTALGLLAVVALVVATGYFVAAEFAFVAVRRRRLEERADAGDRRARRALQVTRRLSFVLSGVQLGITVTSLIVGYLAEPVISAAIEPVLDAIGFGTSAAHGVSVAIGFVIATFATMVLGELAPKS